MTQELFYTSAPQGLRPGSRGFCTVMSTSGMAKNLADRLEALSGYRHVFAANDPNAKLNPIVHSHLRVTVGGKPFHILSRISAAGLDYTQRSNKFAHHVVLEQKELVPAGPAALLAAPGFMESSWEGEPRVIGAGRRPPAVEAKPAPCRYWQRVAGDAGWAGVLAETATAGSSRIAAVIYKPGTDTLRLVCEAMALLPAALRWQVTFSTYYTKLPPEIECQWRFVLAGSPEAKALERSPQVECIDIGAGIFAPESLAASAGRNGNTLPIPSAVEATHPPEGNQGHSGGGHRYARQYQEMAGHDLLADPDFFNLMSSHSTPPPIQSERASVPGSMKAWLILATLGLAILIAGSVLLLARNQRDQLPAESRPIAATNERVSKGDRPAPPATPTSSPPSEDPPKPSRGPTPDAPLSPPDEPKLDKTAESAFLPQSKPELQLHGPVDIDGIWKAPSGSSRASVEIGKCKDLRLQDGKFEIVGGKESLPDGWEMDFGRIDGNQLPIQIRHPDRLNSDGAPIAIANLEISNDALLLSKAKGDLISVKRDMTYQLANCAIKVIFQGQPQVLLLRAPVALSNRVSLNPNKSEQIVSLGTIAAWPDRPLSVQADPGFEQLASSKEYKCVSRGDGIELSRPEWPTFHAKVDSRQKRLVLTCKWPLLDEGGNQRTISAKRSVLRSRLKAISSDKKKLERGAAYAEGEVELNERKRKYAKLEAEEMELQEILTHLANVEAAKMEDIRVSVSLGLQLGADRLVIAVINPIEAADQK